MSQFEVFEQSLRALTADICACVLTSNEEYTQLDDDQWHMILAFQTDQTNLLNELILNCKEKDTILTDQ